MKQYRIVAKGKDAELIVYGVVGTDPWGDQSVEARDIVDALADLTPNSSIRVRINSLGGLVADGLAIYSALKRHPGRVTAAIDGAAYSAASVIAMAGDEIEIADVGTIMVHGPSTFAEGKAPDMRRAADALDRMAAAMSQAYKARGLDAAVVDAWLQDGKDHYFTADEAVTVGLADRISAALPMAASAEPGAARPPTTQVIPMNEDDIKRVRAEEKARNQAIQALAELPIMSILPAEQRQQMVTQAIDDDMDESSATQLFLKALGDNPGAEPIAGGTTPAIDGGTRISGGADVRDKAREGMADVVMLRMNLDRNSEIAKRQSGNEFMGMSCVEMARHSLGLHGVVIKGSNRDQIIAKALSFRGDGGITHTTSDFPAVLENSLNKAVLMGWTETEETWRSIARVGSIADFRPAPRSGLGEYPTLPEIPEGGEYKYVTLTDRKETIVLLTYGSAVGITRQALVNDDLAQFGRIGQKQGRAAARRVGDLVYLVLTSNPTMQQDNTPLFDASHNNIATVTGPPRVDTLDNMRVLMALQKDDASHAHGLNLPLQRVIVPKALETQANVLRASQYDPDSTSRANSRAPNPFQNTFEVVADPRLDAASSTVWYTSSNPNTYDVIEAGFLEGATEPYLESREGWTVDGIEAKVRIDCAAIPLDFRALARNPGA